MKFSQPLVFATALIALPVSALAQNQSASQNVNLSPQAEHEAMQMVPATGALLRTLDARKTKPGDEFRVRLSNKVHLKNGPELPSGTMLIGDVVEDNTQTNGTSNLTVRFTEATLKDGSEIPITATIVGAAPPEPDDANGYPVKAGDQAANNWANEIVQIEVLDIASHVDLHSEIASGNSGVFVAKDHHDIKLGAGSEIELAIAGADSSGSGQRSGNE